MSNSETDIESGSWSGSKNWAHPKRTPLGEHCVQVWFNSIQPSRRSSVLRLSHFITLFWLSDPDPKTEHNPDAPPLGEHCVQVWFKSIQTSRRSSIFSSSGQRPYEVLSYRSVRLSSVVVHNWEKMLLLLDGWMDLKQTWAQCSPSGGAFGVCSVFGSGSGSGSDNNKCVKHSKRYFS